MIGKELREMVSSGIDVIVEFTEQVEDMECRFEKGMRAYVTGVSLADSSNMVTVNFEEKEYREYNKGLEKSIWYNRQKNEYNLKWSEDEYNKNYEGKESLYEMENETIHNFFVVENESSKLFNQYLKENSDKTYVQWLEEKVINQK